jgi:serine phosphatase RsbU (regulator of sigma subunit)/pSer/pThr/pTyr-binding forkhead associated (FHA) protein
MPISRLSSGAPRSSDDGALTTRTPTASPRNDLEGPTSPGTSPIFRGHLEIRLEGGPPARRLIAEPHLVIGRVQGVQVFLDHHTVSRRHAEMFCDPFGRFWIRDLGSTNGTQVNGEPVTEQALSPGDRISIGDYTIAFNVDLPESRGAVRPPPVEFEKPTEIRTLLDFEPPRIAAEHLRTLLTLSRQLISIESPEERLAALCDLAVRDDFQGLSAVVLRVEGGTSVRLSRTHRHGGEVDDDPPYVSRRVLRAVRETREPVLAGNLPTLQEGSLSLGLTISAEVMELGVIACPLGETDRRLDVLYVTLPPACGNAEWLSLLALAAEVYQQSEVAWTARRHAQEHLAIERELGTARQLQRALLPQRLDFLQLDVAVGFEPCKWVGGDYVDAVQLADGRVLLAVADVCGKGLQAALVTSSLHTMVRAALDSGPTVSQLVERVNHHLCEWLPSHSFVTMVVAAIDPRTGEIECVNAGHPPVLVADRDGDVRLLQSAANPALGVAPCSIEPQRALLEYGDVLLMCTDGLTELRGGDEQEMLGLERLGERFARICAERPDERSASVAEALHAMLERYRGDELPGDDRAYVIAQRRR